MGVKCERDDGGGGDDEDGESRHGGEGGGGKGMSFDCGGKLKQEIKTEPMDQDSTIKGYYSIICIIEWLILSDCFGLL